MRRFVILTPVFFNRELFHATKAMVSIFPKVESEYLKILYQK